MSICKVCKKQIEEGAKFCPNCGTSVEEKNFCPNCGTEQIAESAFCSQCGESLHKNVNEMKRKDRTKHFKVNKKVVGVICAIAGIVVVVLGIFALTSKKESAYALYIKDGEVYYTDGKEELGEITGNLTVGEEASNYDLQVKAYEINEYITYSKDGNRVFFVDRVNDSDYGYTLYYKDLNKKDAEAEKIDTGILSYAINEEGTRIIYLNIEDHTLYMSDLNEKTKITNEVSYYNISEDFDTVSFLNYANSYCFWNVEDGLSKISNDVWSVEYEKNDFSEVYFLTGEDSLCKYTKNGDEKETIATDVEQVIGIFDSGECYYTHSEGYRYDDTYNFCNICYFDGEDETILEYEACLRYREEYKRASNESVVIIETCNEDNQEEGFSEIYVAHKNSLEYVAEVKEGDYWLSADGKKLFYAQNYTGDYGHDLYVVDIIEGKVGESKLYDTDVSWKTTRWLTDNKLLYFKSIDDYISTYWGDFWVSLAGTMYVDKTKIDDGVVGNLMKYNESTGELWYLKDYSLETDTGTLCSSKYGEIAEDVWDYVLMEKGECVYLGDYVYEDDTYLGTLYAYDKNKSLKISDDVISLVPLTDARFKGDYNEY